MSCRDVTCPNCSGLPEQEQREHCFHLLAAPYNIAGVAPEPVLAIPELCCQCGSARLTIRADAAPDADQHGQHIRFDPLPEPQVPEPPKPSLLVLPGQRRVLH
jgi:hypothetical protein